MATEQKMSRWGLTAMVVGGMVGAGIFSLPRTFANATGPLGALIAWLIAGTGMYMLARVFQALAERIEVSGETVFFYTQDARALLGALSVHPGLRTLHRPANLEDLFLKLTGRQIREEG